MTSWTILKAKLKAYFDTVYTVITTAADNTATTGVASTAFAKSQDTVLARAPDRAVEMTAAASGSSGITVADDPDIDFGTGNFTVSWVGSVPDWTPAAAQILLQKLVSSVGYKLEARSTGVIRITLNTSSLTLVSPHGFVDGTTHSIVVTISIGAVNTTGVFYLDGVLAQTSTFANAGTASNADPLYILGTSAIRYAGRVSSVHLFNRALTAEEVLDLYRNTTNFADKWGSQTVQTSGTLVIGKRYLILDWITDDDFTNVGGTNADNTEFVATGTTPTHWAHSSTVYEIGAVLALEPEGIESDKWYDSSTNANNAAYPAAGSTLTRRLNFATLPTAADNSAAATAGVLVGGLYRTSADPSVICTRTA